MNRRLFIDHLRRNWSTISTPAWFVAAMWFADAMGGISPQMALAFSMTSALLYGPVKTSEQLTPAEVRLLPISSREIWQTGWWLSVVVPAVVLTLAKFVGCGIAILLSTDSQNLLHLIGLSTALDVAYAGACLSILPALRTALNPNTQARPAHVRYSLASLAILIFVSLLVGPFIVAGSLPTAWEQLTGVKALALVAALGLTVANFFRAPSRAVALNRAAIRAAWKTPSRLWTPDFENVSGIWRIALQTWKAAMLMQVALPVIIIGAMTLVGGLFDTQGGGWMATAREFGFFPFEESTPSHNPSNLLLLYFLGAAGASWPFAMLGYNDIFQFMMRHLRTLPLSTRQLDALILVVPLVSWINLWALLAVLHMVVLGHAPDSFRLPAWLALIGIDALVRALYLRLRTYLWPGILGTVTLLIALVLGKVAFGSIPTVATVGGLLALASAWTLNYHTLTRTRLVYARTTVLTRFAPGLPQE